jgi:nucleoside 2-deoxyribosyltransferase
MYRGFQLNRTTPDVHCPVCNAECFGRYINPGYTQIICPICGKFSVGDMAGSFITSPSGQKDNITYKLSHFFRSISERTFGESGNSLFPIYSLEDLKRVLDKPDPPVREKLLMLLRYIASLSNYPGQTVGLEPANDYPVLCAKNRAETDYYIQALGEDGMISVERTLGGEPNCTITTRGWQELEKAEQSGADSPNGFIAMWFDPSQDATRESIKSAITAAGYLPIRIDEVEHVNRIDDEILAKIRQSKFLVADFNGQRHGVYFEAGFMLGLGRTVIWTCSKSDFDNVHFDTRQYNTIVYENTDELKTRLQFRIEAILGKGPITV